MVTLKVDLHVHTNHSDATATLEDVLNKAKERGLNGVAVTDHMTLDAFEGVPELVDGILVIPGFEVETRDGHLLILGVKKLPPLGISFLEAVEWTHRLGGIAIAAHPKVPGFSISDEVILVALPDAVETMNAKVPLSRWNRASVVLAEKLGLPQTGGSDSHSAVTVGDAYTLVEADELSVEGVLNAVKAGRVKPGGSRSSFYQSFLTIIYGALFTLLQQPRQFLRQFKFAR